MTTRQELTCQELVELVTDYLEGALLPAERMRFDAHLATCDGCRTYVEQMRQTIQLLGQLSADQIEPAARDDLLGLFRTWKQQK